MKKNLLLRGKQLLNFLKDENYFGQYEFVIFHSPKPNQMIFNKDVIFEGYKIGAVHGFGLTSVIRNPARIDFEIQAFDVLFNNLRTRTLQTSSTGVQLGEAEEKEILRKEACQRLEDGLKSLKESLGIV
jgi:hypothetical protein